MMQLNKIYGRSPSINVLILFTAGLLWHSYGDETATGSSNIISQSLAPFSAPSEKTKNTLFEKLDNDHTGINFQPTPESERSFEFRKQLNSYAPSAGVAVGDYDGDGRPDIFISSTDDAGRLYRNDGDFKFTDVTASANIKTDSFWGTGVTFADINNDGMLDLYLCGHMCTNRLYVNQGDGTFIEQAKNYGLDYCGASTIMAFIDYDRDGDLDGYLLTYTASVPGDDGSDMLVKTLPSGQVIIPPEDQEKYSVLYLSNGEHKIIQAGQFDYLFRNENGKRFTDVSKEAGIYGPNHEGLSATWFDYDGNMWPDLYVANDYLGPDHLYQHNGNQEHPAFTNRIRTAVPHVPWYSMGSDFGDFNNDGLLDMIGADMASTSHYRSKLTMGDMSTFTWLLDYADPQQYMRNMLLINTGRNSFFEAAHMAGIASSGWTWAVRVADLDCDGKQDVFMTTGMVKDFMNSDLMIQANRIIRPFRGRGHAKERQQLMTDYWKDKPALKQPNLAFRNTDGLTFKESGKSWGLNDLTVSFGTATGDFDGDGDLDLVVKNYSSQPGVFRNHAGSIDPKKANRIKIRLKGTASNASGIGATVRLTSPSGEQVRYLTLARGCMSSSEPVVIFGLNDDEDVHSLSVEWPSGTYQEFRDLDVNRFYTITEAKDSAHLHSKSDQTTKPLMTELQGLQNIVHREVEYDDFKDQPLLPNKLSQLGPGLAWEDINGDGYNDLFMSGAKGQSGRLITLNRSDLDKEADKITAETLRADKEYEDMAPLFFDADSDGDQDLYVVSGSVEHQTNTVMLQDRLYVNNGKGEFTRAPEGSLPKLMDSGSCVAASDFDRDGDLDLFVGGRVVPGAYPSSPKSRLLRNDSTDEEGIRFTDITKDTAPELLEAGMVTGALWTDPNNDGWQDLMVTYEWGPVRLFSNAEGKLTDKTIEAGLADRLGWYNSINGGDIDHDGDIDYVVGNFGLNTKYHPKPKAPIFIYYGDFDGTGIKQVVEAKVKKDHLLPTRGKSCSQNAMPFLRKKCPTYDSFASKLLEDIYEPATLDEAEKVTANSLESGVLMNNGDGTFEFRPLPVLAQISPVFGTVLIDINLDGKLDIVLAQNFFTPQRETGHMDGGVGLVLLGDGTGAFTEMWPNASGFEIRKDATALTLGDMNGDHLPDLICAVNDGHLRAFLTEKNDDEGKFVKITLQGLAGNPDAIGSTITATYNDGSKLALETYAGGGYLSQSPSDRWYTIPKGKKMELISVMWPNGSMTETKVKETQSITLHHPSFN